MCPRATAADPAAPSAEQLNVMHKEWRMFQLPPQAFLLQGYRDTKVISIFRR